MTVLREKMLGQLILRKVGMSVSSFMRINAAVIEMFGSEPPEQSDSWPVN